MNFFRRKPPLPIPAPPPPPPAPEKELGCVAQQVVNDLKAGGDWKMTQGKWGTEFTKEGVKYTLVANYMGGYVSLLDVPNHWFEMHEQAAIMNFTGDMIRKESERIKAEKLKELFPNCP
jgi:hypothetical protein